MFKVTHLVVSRPEAMKYKPGDYVYINIPAIAAFEWHPFTFSSNPERQGLYTASSSNTLRQVMYTSASSIQERQGMYTVASSNPERQGMYAVASSNPER